MSFDARYLLSFWVVCREGGFGRAARRLHRTQPAISYQLKMLEAELGAPLVERTRGPLILTAEGRRVLEFCERFFAEWSQLTAALAGGAEARAAPLRIAAASGFGRYVLFPLLRAAMPGGAPLELRYPTADEIFARVADGRCDVGFSYVARVSSNLAVSPVWEEELVLVAAARGAPRRAAPARLDAYERAPFVTYDECDYVFGRYFAARFGRQPSRLASAHHFEELEEVLAAVAAGSGFSIVPDFCAAGRRDLQIVRAGRRCTNQIFAVFRPGGPRHPGARLVLERLAEARRGPRPRRRG
jgi:LysR family transcriptional regulator, cyn operon transcriptional activator